MVSWLFTKLKGVEIGLPRTEVAERMILMTAWYFILVVVNRGS